MTVTVFFDIIDPKGMRGGPNTATCAVGLRLAALAVDV
jgi:hypothetical protein